MSDREKQPGPDEPAANDPLAGTSYHLLRHLAGGAMGEIVEAEHVPLRRKVIVKLIRRIYAKQPGFVDRFRIEAQALAALAPRTLHIVGVLDVGETAEGRPFLVLEKLRGRTLKEELAARGALPPSEAITIARQLLDALRCAHDAGIVHRDVKPDNMFLAESERTERGERGDRLVKLLDFGIAKVLPGASEEHSPAPLALPTEEGTTLGTPRYLSPEQARGIAIDHRSDLYSAGAVLYAMLTGKDPFAHVQGIAAVLRAQVFELPRPPSLVAAQPIPAGLDRIVLKALAKGPEDRFASAAEFSSALEVALVPQPPAPAATPTGTELMDVSAFRGAGPKPQKSRNLAKTEPLPVPGVYAAAAAIRSRAVETVAPTAAPDPPLVPETNAAGPPSAELETLVRAAPPTRSPRGRASVVVMAACIVVSLLLLVLAAVLRR